MSSRKTRPARKITAVGAPKLPPVPGGMSERIGRNILAAMFEARIPSVQKLAQAMGCMSISNLNRRLSGEYRWYLDDVDRVAQAIGCDPIALLSGSPETILTGAAAELYADADGLGFAFGSLTEGQQDVAIRHIGARLLGIESATAPWRFDVRLTPEDVIRRA
jgi:hypothetical protein